MSEEIAKSAQELKNAQTSSEEKSVVLREKNEAAKIANEAAAAASLVVKNAKGDDKAPAAAELKKANEAKNAADTEAANALKEVEDAATIVDDLSKKHAVLVDADKAKQRAEAEKADEKPKGPYVTLRAVCGRYGVLGVGKSVSEKDFANGTDLKLLVSKKIIKKV